ncbi:hypothetical protein P8631_21310, partial [Guyparkeria sp. 1SP6A2]|nr:hypothetical protein [Guyparkeria sp. 1SP6A2]
DPLIDDGGVKALLTQGQTLIQRGLREAYVIDGDGEIRSRGDRSYLFYYQHPTVAQMASVRDDGFLLIEDWQNNEFRALVALPP